MKHYILLASIIFIVLLTTAGMTAPSLSDGVTITDKVDNTTDNFVFTKDSYAISSRLTHIGFDETIMETVKPTDIDKDEFKGVFTDTDMKIIETKDGVKEYLYFNKNLTIGKANQFWIGYQMDFPLTDVYYQDGLGYTKWDWKTDFESKKIKFFNGNDYLFRLATPHLKFNATDWATGKYKIQKDGDIIRLWVIFQTDWVKDAVYPIIMDPAVDTRVDIGNTGSGYANRAGSSKSHRIVANSTGHLFVGNYIYTGSSGDNQLIISAQGHYYSGTETAIEMGGTVGSILYTGDSRAIDMEINNDILYWAFDCEGLGGVCVSQCDTSTGCAASANWDKPTDGTDGYDLLATIKNPDALEVWNDTWIGIVAPDESGTQEIDLYVFDGTTWNQKDLTSGSADKCSNGRLNMINATWWTFLAREHVLSDETVFAQTFDNGTTWVDHSESALPGSTCDQMETVIDEGGEHEPQQCTVDNITESTICSDRDITNKDSWFIKINVTGFFTQETNPSGGAYSVGIGFDTVNGDYYQGYTGLTTDYYVENSTDIGETFGTVITYQDNLAGVRGGGFTEILYDSNTTVMHYWFTDEGGDNIYWAYIDMRAGAPPPPADAEPPTWGSVAKNDSIICPYEPVNFTSSLWNDNTTLDSWIFSLNLTGTWENASSVAFVEPNATENVTTIIVTPLTVVEWKFFGNDTENNENVTATQSFVVANCTTNASTTAAAGTQVFEFYDPAELKSDYVGAVFLALGIIAIVMIYFAANAYPQIAPLFALLSILSLVSIMVVAINIENISSSVISNSTDINSTMTTRNATVSLAIPTQMSNMLDNSTIVLLLVFFGAGSLLFYLLAAKVYLVITGGKHE